MVHSQQTVHIDLSHEVNKYDWKYYNVVHKTAYSILCSLLGMYMQVVYKPHFRKTKNLLDKNKQIDISTAILVEI
jgi:hypothetical protein